MKIDFVKAFLASKGNLSTKDFLDNGYTMENFIRYTQSNASFDKMRMNLLDGAIQAGKNGNAEAVETIKLIEGSFKNEASSEI